MNPILILLSMFGAPIFFGTLAFPVTSPIITSIGIAIAIVLRGWRAGRSGLFGSVLLGAILQMVVALPIYFVAAWMAG